MAWQIPANCVDRGIIDNTKKGLVKVALWLHGRAEPMCLELTGHPRRDMAGCRVEFKCRADAAHTSVAFDLDLPMQQRGSCGEISASEKRKIPDVDPIEAMDLEDAGLPVPAHFENIIYLEWFTPEQGRIVLEGTGMTISISAPEWEMTSKDERQAQDQAEAYMQGLVDELSGESFEVPEEREMDEFEWEEFLKERDRRTDALSELLEKFGHDEKGWQEAAKFMGWDHLSEDADDDGDEVDGPDFDSPGEEDIRLDLESNHDADEDDEEAADQDMERSWGRTNTLSERLSIMLQERTALRKDNPDPDADAGDFEIALMTLSAKLAGALNCLELGQHAPERGMTIALLKRTIPMVDEVISHMDEENVAPAHRAEIFSVREAILGKIQELRAGI